LSDPKERLELSKALMETIVMPSNELDQKAYSSLLTHFSREMDDSAAEISSAVIEKEFEQVQKSMENASKDYEIMMKIHQELKENFQKLVQNKG
jgi:hypothetical protein